MKKYLPSFKLSILKLKEKRGFTLIELVIVFTVLIILSVIGIASFVSYSRTQTLVNDSNNLITVLDKARSNAQTQVKKTITDCSSGDSLSGYIVTISISTNTYDVGIICSGSNPNPQNETTYPLSKNVTFDSATEITTIFYPVLTGTICINDNTCVSGMPSGKIVLDLSPGSIKRQITIDNKGIIKSQPL